MTIHSKIKFIFIILFLIYFNSYAFSNDNAINRIEVEGTQRIDKETVISYSNLEIGAIYNEEVGNKVLKDLFETNLFSDIETLKKIQQLI